MSRPFLLILVAFACLPVGCGPSPEDAYAAFVASARQGEWETVYGMLDTASRDALDQRVQTLLRDQADGADPAARYDELDPPALFARLADRHPTLHQTFDIAGFTVFDTQINDGQASLTAEVLRGGETVPLVVRLHREDGAWKVAWP